MTPEHANATLRFLENTPLTGKEAGPFVQCVLALQAVAKGEVVMAQPKPADTAED